MKGVNLAFAALLLSGCASTGVVSESTPDNYQPPSVSSAQRSERGEHLEQRHGSLYSDSYMFTLFADKRAYRIGDILTVVLNERTLSSKSADSSLDKNTQWDLGIPVAGTRDVSDLALEVKSGVGFDGESSASQQNYLSGAITVRVTDVLPNGALSIMGRKQIRLNQGDEFIELMGVVRPEDIDVANRISSQRIADAKISYEGRGTLASASEPGWLTSLVTRFLNPF